MVPERSSRPDGSLVAAEEATAAGSTRPIEYTHVGRLGWIVSRLCLGTMNFGPHTTEPDSRRIMDIALANGVDVFGAMSSPAPGRRSDQR